MMPLFGCDQPDMSRQCTESHDLYEIKSEIRFVQVRLGCAGLHLISHRPLYLTISFFHTMAMDALPSSLTGQLDVLMIDNFDSFTWNLYQQISLLGANVTVIRNDAILPSHLSQLKINSLIISPGPGHPQTDSGISKAAIEYFQGKVPVLGVCMGLECLVDLYGGEIG